MADETWHYLENQFDSVTAGSRGHMNALLADTHAKLTRGATDDPALAPILADLTLVKTDWDAAYRRWKDARATWRSVTQAQMNLAASLRLAPAPGERSRIDRWESKVGAEWARSHPIYAYLFPRGREPFTEGTLENIIDEVENLGTRLTAKAADPAANLTPPQAALLTTLASEVTAFHGQLDAARAAQQEIEGLVHRTADLCNQQRTKAATALYRALARLMDAFAEPEQRGQVTSFFDLTLIMAPPSADEDEGPLPPPGGGSAPLPPTL